MKSKLIIVIGVCVLSASTSVLVKSAAENEVKGQIKSNNGSTMESMEQKQIEQLLSKYEQALNQSSTEAVLPLYAKDGVFIPTEAPTAQGIEQLKAAYDHVFNTIKLDIKFNIEEIVVSGDFAFAKTLSRGKVTILQAKITVPEENRELFVFRKDDGVWRIARYMFNKSKPKA